MIRGPLLRRIPFLKLLETKDEAMGGKAKKRIMKIVAKAEIGVGRNVDRWRTEATKDVDRAGEDRGDDLNAELTH